MVFSSLTFIVLFLPIFLICYFIVPKKYVGLRNLVLLLFSLLFYAAGEPIWVVLLIFSASFDCLLSIFIEKYRGKWQSKVLIGLSMAGSLGLLVFFKYTEFLFGLVGIHIAFQPVLPIGISFYTFQTMSYSIDVYRGKIKAQRSPIAFLTYVAMFPPLIAGPIIRYAHIEKMLTNRDVTFHKVSEGISRFVMGLGKKVIFANHAGVISAELLGSQNPSTMGVWLGAIMFMFQIYFDFSGYSDMAIGLGKMIGFDFRENFNYPYTAKSITNFWRQWHISLGDFFREYVYIPLGGNRVKTPRAVFNILFVWMITGLWHGASINFVLWGIYFGFILLIEKYAIKNLLKKIPAVLAHCYALAVVLFGWLIFYFVDLTMLRLYIGRFFGGGDFLTDYRSIEILLQNIWILGIFAIFSTRVPIDILESIAGRAKIVPVFFNIIVFAISFMLLIGQTFSPFIYFRF